MGYELDNQTTAKEPTNLRAIESLRFRAEILKMIIDGRLPKEDAVDTLIDIANWLDERAVKGQYKNYGGHLVARSGIWELEVCGKTSFPAALIVRGGHLTNRSPFPMQRCYTRTATVGDVVDEIHTIVGLGK